MPTELEKAYLAGLFDGEGSIGIYAVPSSRWHLYVSTVAIKMCDSQGARLAHALYGGSLRIAPARPPNRPQYCWKCSNDGAATFLADVRPYLRVKAEQADLFMRFRETLQGFNRRGRGSKVPANVIELRAEIAAQCKALKRA